MKSIILNYYFLKELFLYPTKLHFIRDSRFNNRSLSLITFFLAYDRNCSNQRMINTWNFERCTFLLSPERYLSHDPNDQLYPSCSISCSILSFPFLPNFPYSFEHRQRSTTPALFTGNYISPPIIRPTFLYFLRCVLHT